MLLIKWFLWRRWMLKKWLKPGPGSFLINAPKVNCAGCNTHPIIYRDMCRIVRSIK